MTVALGSAESKKPPGGVSGSRTRGKQPPGRWKHRDEGWRAYPETERLPDPRADRDMGLVDALKVQALIAHYACRAQLTARQYRVLMAVMGHVLRWQRLEDHAPAALLSRFSGVPQSVIGIVLTELDVLGFIKYQAGVGKTQNRVRVLVPEGWEAKSGPWVSTDSVDSAESEDSTDSAESKSSDSDESVSTEPEESESTDSVDRSGGSFERTLTGGEGGGGKVLALPSGTVAAPPSPVASDAQSVLDAYCRDRAEAGVPVVKVKDLLTPIREVLRSGYSPRAVLMGLGMWDEEGFRSPRQIAEWVEKAARQGREPQEPSTAADLLVEGRRRYTIYLARKTLTIPSKAEVRRVRSMASIQSFTQGAP